MSGGSGTGTRAIKPSAPPSTSALRAQMELDLIGLYSIDEFAETVIYQPMTGDTIEISAIVTRGQGDEYKGSDETSTKGSIRIKASDIAMPMTNDLIVTESERWLVVNPEQSEDGLEWICEISKFNR
jgi:hypothetical protein